MTSNGARWAPDKNPPRGLKHLVVITWITSISNMIHPNLIKIILLYRQLEHCNDKDNAKRIVRVA